ncbi:MAG TPA: RluA family pseudouridine synthase [Blastocatellia bacterium]|nr:RluA family pseudouridine synthase [Blastocatellia bacterium]HMV84891.1 RluA family pseudouridine synthase [Blastocatellia bacterium]HMX27510.1 RluA family pseudouridine synthase [Blastocatellia bacterium]HMY71767.1 RluA family pseudouridine synthase [Blastocatellia bacterium]HMZ17594.1 RluA family pseudouridine synthase [Blastocatellia bacterium]
MTESEKDKEKGRSGEEEIEEVEDSEPSDPIHHFDVPPEAVGTRLDTYLAAQIPTTSRSQVRRAIELGKVFVNRQQVVKPAYEVSAGEAIQISLPPTQPLEAKPEAIPLDIVHEDDEIIVINKPAGMVTHPGAGVKSGTLANALVHHFNEQQLQLPRRGGASRPGIVHRLDVGTSGLIVVAKTDRAHLALAEQFQSRTVRKIYSALVYGVVKDDEGRIEAPIGRDPRSRVKMAIRPPGEGRDALSLYRVAERFDDFTLLDVEIKTGRTHQIRVHLAHIKHPIVADPTYDAGRANSIKRATLRAAISKLDRPFLHAAQLRFTHPGTSEIVEFRAPLPEDLRGFLNLLRG